MARHFQRPPNGFARNLHILFGQRCSMSFGGVKTY